MKELRGFLLDGMKERTDRSGLIYPSMAERQAAINQKIASLISPLPYDNLLDICSGAMGLYGNIDCGYTGIDISSLSLEVHPSQNVVQADAAAIPFKDAAFDHAACIMALHSSFSTRHTIAEVARVLKDGGQFTLAENGISQWVCNLLLLGSDFGQVLGEKDLDMAKSFFDDRSIDPQEYVALTSHDLFGRSTREIFDGIVVPETTSRKKRSSIRYSMVRAMNTAFHHNVEGNIESNGFRPIHKSIIPVYGDKAMWTVADPIPVDPQVSTASHYCRLNESGIEGVPSPSDLRASSILYLFVDTYKKK